MHDLQDKLSSIEQQLAQSKADKAQVEFELAETRSQRKKLEDERQDLKKNQERFRAFLRQLATADVQASERRNTMWNNFMTDMPDDIVHALTMIRGENLAEPNMNDNNDSH